MSVKDIALDFINFVFLIFLIIFCIIYFIAGDNFMAFSRFMESMVPLAFFGIIFLIRIKMTRSEVKARKSHGGEEITLHLDVTHKLVSDVIIFCAPIFLGLIIYKGRGYIDVIDVLALVTVFLIMFFWQRYLFNKER